MKKSLFTIPFAGGNRYAFKDFNIFLDSHFDLYHLEFSGRGDRISENLTKDIYEIRDDLFSQIKNNLDTKYVIYGHSMGGLLAYLLVLLIAKEKLPLPEKIVISGRSNPMQKPKKIRHNLPKEEFKNSLKELEGTPNAVLEHSELFDFFEPILRADFEAIESYDFQESKKVDVDFTILYGINERGFTEEEARNWSSFTSKDSDFYKLEGGHFFIYNHIEKICDILKDKS